MSEIKGRENSKSIYKEKLQANTKRKIYLRNKTYLFGEV